jgi:myo-inositol catabolism protein IolH
VADAFDHTPLSGNRYIINPPGSTARVHQHLDIGQGEVDWDEFFGTLARIGFDGIATVCVFAWEERAHESCAGNLEKVRQYVAKVLLVCRSRVRTRGGTVLAGGLARQD